MPATRGDGRRWGGLGIKLFLSYLAVVAVGLVTFLVAVDLAAPSFFAGHMAPMMAGRAMEGMMGPAMASRMEQMAGAMDAAVASAFRAALTEALLVAGGAAIVAAVIASLLVAGRVMGPVRRLAAASRRLASGHYAERVPVESGDELGDLAASFNEMASALEATERRRLDLIGDVAHELRTPVATLEGYLEGLLDGVVEPTERTWVKLHDEAGRLRRLIDDLQELSRAEARQVPLTLGPVASADIIRTALDRLGSQFAEKGLSLTIHVADGLPPAYADRDRAVQVLTNLLTNALRYTPAPGSVRLSAHVSGDEVQFTVADSGIGIAPEHLPHLFERFYRVDKSRSRTLGGTGVGLAIARALVEAMGGRIWAESAGLGQGATFAFTLPVVRSPFPPLLSQRGSRGE